MVCEKTSPSIATSINQNRCRGEASDARWSRSRLRNGDPPSALYDAGRHHHFVFFFTELWMEVLPDFVFVVVLPLAPRIPSFNTTGVVKLAITKRRRPTPVVEASLPCAFRSPGGGDTCSVIVPYSY